ncbi:hypothetical protein B0H10DRAFT_18705 [Mycena sp. CBHHK59/15]|nr:hypothetical protein B0H10DRAFT_18705 [Mycena sp. CBHHK59/15]
MSPDTGHRCASSSLKVQTINQEASDLFDLADEILQDCQAARNVPDLDTAIYLLQGAVYSRLPAHPDLPLCLSYLATALATRFTSTNRISDARVEFAEARRSVFWSQALQIRTPLTDLRLIDPELARKVSEILR